MIITGIDRQKAGETAELLEKVFKLAVYSLTTSEYVCLTALYDALRDAERRPIPTPTLQQYADGAD